MRGRTFRSSGAGHVAVLDVDHDAGEAGCFADEVAIDFPSMCAAVDRIRSAFVADERPAPLGTVIRVSPGEARAGTTVPLEVPLRTTCADCGGRGESWAEPCLRCAGTGSRMRWQPLQVTLPAGVLDGTRLHFTVSARHHLPTRIDLRIVVHGIG